MRYRQYRVGEHLVCDVMGAAGELVARFVDGPGPAIERDTDGRISAGVDVSQWAAAQRLEIRRLYQSAEQDVGRPGNQVDIVALSDGTL